MASPKEQSRFTSGLSYIWFDSMRHFFLYTGVLASKESVFINAQNMI